MKAACQSGNLRKKLNDFTSGGYLGCILDGMTFWSFGQRLYIYIGVEGLLWEATSCISLVEMKGPRMSPRGGGE